MPVDVPPRGLCIQRILQNNDLIFCPNDLKMHLQRALFPGAFFIAGELPALENSIAELSFGKRAPLQRPSGKIQDDILREPP